jgi:hypothetical protein
MTNKEINAVHVWKQLEDLAVPRLRLTVLERAVYSHLLRHSRLEGKRQIRFSIQWVAQSAGLTDFSERKNVRRLVAKGALRLAERSKRGHVVEVRLPEEIPAVRAVIIGGGREARPGGAANLEEADFLEPRGAAGSDPRARGRPLLLLFAAADAGGAVHRPRDCGSADGK